MKITRDDHEILFIGFGFALALGALIGAALADPGGYGWPGFIGGVAVTVGLWLFGFIAFILTRPD